MAMAAAPTILDHRLRDSMQIAHNSEGDAEGDEDSEPLTSAASDQLSFRSEDRRLSSSRRVGSDDQEHEDDERDGRNTENHTEQGEEEDELTADHGKPRVRRGQQQGRSKSKEIGQSVQKRCTSSRDKTRMNNKLSETGNEREIRSLFTTPKNRKNASAAGRVNASADVGLLPYL